MSDARWGDPREYDARDSGYEWPRVYDSRELLSTSSNIPRSVAAAGY